jgi:hypothetical protein
MEPMTDEEIYAVICGDIDDLPADDDLPKD